MICLRILSMGKVMITEIHTWIERRSWDSIHTVVGRCSKTPVAARIFHGTASTMANYALPRLAITVTNAMKVPKVP